MLSIPSDCLLVRVGFELIVRNMLPKVVRLVDFRVAAKLHIIDALEQVQAGVESGYHS